MECINNNVTNAVCYLQFRRLLILINFMTYVLAGADMIALECLLLPVFIAQIKHYYYYYN